MTRGGIIAIDSGVLPGVAYFSPSGELVASKVTCFPTGAGLVAVVVEAPEYRGAKDSPMVPALFKMTAGGYLAAGHALAGSPGAALVELTPMQWKEREPKPANHSRLWFALTPKERAILGGRATENAIAAACEKGADRGWRGEGADCYPKSQKALTDRLCAAALGCTYLGRLRKASEL